MQEEERLSLREAAEALGISEVTARRWIKTGKLKAAQPGRKYLVPRNAVEDLLQADSPKVPEPFSLEWARTASDAEFYRLIVVAPEEDTDRLDKLSAELRGYLSRPVRRILTERNNRTFEDQRPGAKGDEEERLRERFDALYAEVNRRRPPFAIITWRGAGPAEVRWLVPEDQREDLRSEIEETLKGEEYIEIGPADPATKDAPPDRSMSLTRSAA